MRYALGKVRPSLLLHEVQVKQNSQELEKGKPVENINNKAQWVSFPLVGSQKNMPTQLILTTFWQVPVLTKTNLRTV